MIQFPVYSLCTYRTSLVPTWRSQDYEANQFVRALKGRPFRGYAWMDDGSGSFTKVTYETRDEAIAVFGRRAARVLEPLGLPKRLTVIPIPNSYFATGYEGQCRTGMMAGHIVGASGNGEWGVETQLRWRTPIETGIRDADQLYEELLPLGFVALTPDVVLLDDVLTSGAHMQAAARRVHDAGMRVVAGIVAGRADRDVVADPFATRVDTIAWG